MTNQEIKQKKKPASPFNLADITSSIKQDLKKGKQENKSNKNSQTAPDDSYMFTGIEGFDALLTKGIPKGLNIILEGKSGAGKTIFALQLAVYHAQNKKKCLFISFEESEERLINHMETFGWNPKKLIEQGHLIIKRYLSTDIYYEEDHDSGSVKAMMARNSDHVTLDLEPFIIGSEGLDPDIIIIDSLTSIASTFQGKEHNYRFYLERLFRFFEKIGSTNFLIYEPYSNGALQLETQCERFLSDGIIVLYNARHGNIRENAIEILKMRGAEHEKKIVAMKITSEGIKVYPEQEVFGEMEI